MTTLQILYNLSAFNSFCSDSSKRRRSCFSLKHLQPINFYSLSRANKVGFCHQNGFKVRAFEDRRFLLGENSEKNQILIGVERIEKKNKRRVVLVKFNQGFGFNGGGGGGGNNNNSRLLGNIAFAIGITYLSVTGQLGWILDAIVSIWLLAVILPIAGLGAFFWWAGRDIVQSSCPNCGNDFQIFKSSLKDGQQRCPFCSQPFSVEGNVFVRESSPFSSNQSTTFGQAFDDFPASSKKGKASSVSVVDIEAEVTDVE